MHQLKRFLAYAAPALLYAALIFFLSTRENLPSLPGIHMDKVAHLAEYGMFGSLFARALYAYGLAPRRALLIAILVGGLFGISDEFHQSFTPGRAVEFLDFVADLVGATGGASLWYAVVSELWGFGSES